MGARYTQILKDDVVKFHGEMVTLEDAQDAINYCTYKVHYTKKTFRLSIMTTYVADMPTVHKALIAHSFQRYRGPAPEGGLEDQLGTYLATQ